MGNTGLGLAQAVFVRFQNGLLLVQVHSISFHIAHALQSVFGTFVPFCYLGFCRFCHQHPVGPDFMCVAHDGGVFWLDGRLKVR